MCLNENVCESVFYFKPKDEHKKSKCLIKVIEIIIRRRFAYTLHMQKAKFMHNSALFVCKHIKMSCYFCSFTYVELQANNFKKFPFDYTFIKEFEQKLHMTVHSVSVYKKFEEMSTIRAQSQPALD